MSEELNFFPGMACGERSTLDTLHTLIERGAQVKWDTFWVSVNRYIRNFVQVDLAKGLYSEEESNKVKVLTLGTI